MRDSQLEVNQSDPESWLRDNAERVVGTTGMAHGGRILAFDEPERVGWNEVRRHAEQLGRVGLLLLPVHEADNLDVHFGPGWHKHRWSIFLGDAEQVLPVCSEIVRATRLDEGWHLGTFEDDPRDEVLQEVAALNRLAGIVPQPAWYLRGDVLPSATTLLRDAGGRLVGAGAAQARHHPEGTWAGLLFVGLISVHPELRGRGLGRLMNAFTIMKALARLPGNQVEEYVAPDNAPSRATVQRCGLVERPEMVTVVISREASRFTR